ncbi:hypothetical protein BKA65DRAFT_527279 [Rhexocercosporidium sp. MPI-PUGE-AT-0058]|nr:hypothetical protein BKA65DRAFT_527279 [Rhexocercosporidium sp. MPI-PUGE-AT-0058]
MEPFPPQRSVASIPVSQDIALKYLSTYLEAAKTSPHLLPNARLEPSGPTAGSSTSNITIHNLQRVEAGLRGEWLAPTLDLEEGNVPIAEGMDDGTTKEHENAEGEGWMDLDQYQREQSIEGGDVGDRLPGAVQDVELDSDLEMENKGNKAYGHKLSSAPVPATMIDKEARKAEKKRRGKEDKQKRAAKRASQHAD